ncbi:hypothetical protein KQ298_01745 [Synechococcus sp. CS-1330]|nr:hypothetical protein [Synechococcus sp. CS-1330]
MTASLYRRIAHVLKPPDVLTIGVTSFLKPGALAAPCSAKSHNDYVHSSQRAGLARHSGLNFKIIMLIQNLNVFCI